MSLRETPKDHLTATIDDVARRAGVSTATVSRVINNTASVAEKTRQSVLRAVQELRYRPQSAAQILAGKKTNTIGLLFPTISGEFFSPLLSGIERGARENGYNILVFSTQNAIQNDPEVPLPIGKHNTDGFLVFVNSLNQQELFRLYKNDFPVVLIHQSPPNDLPIPSVTIENKSGARRIVDHLIEVHHYQNIAFLAGSIDQEDTYWREMGYRESLTQHGYPINPDLIGSGGFNRENARIMVEKWLSNGVNFDAIFTADDEMGIGVIAAIHRFGLTIPNDIALVGFDDIYLSQYLTPPLTTVRAPTEQVGREAIQLLIKKINGRWTDQAILLPTELVIRQSCGCP